MTDTPNDEILIKQISWDRNIQVHVHIIKSQLPFSLLSFHYSLLMCYTHLHVYVIPNTSTSLTHNHTPVLQRSRTLISISSTNMGTTPQLMTVLVWRDELC